MDNLLSKTDNQIVKMYIKSLEPNEIKALEIAIDHLESSFDIEKSIGFIKFKQNLSSSPSSSSGF